MMKIRTKSYIEKLLPELKPNSEPMLMGIASAPILQNPLLVAVLSVVKLVHSSIWSRIGFSLSNCSKFVAVDSVIQNPTTLKFIFNSVISHATSAIKKPLLVGNIVNSNSDLSKTSKSR